MEEAKIGKFRIEVDGDTIQIHTDDDGVVLVMDGDPEYGTQILFSDTPREHPVSLVSSTGDYIFQAWSDADIEPVATTSGGR